MSTVTKEVITLQIGHFSNFVGTHLWNIQESSFCYSPEKSSGLPKEIENDVLYREGRTLLGEVTYTPRLISVDLKGSLNTLKPDGVLYDIESEGYNLPWGGDVTLHQATPPHKNSFLSDLDSAEAMQVSDNDLVSPDKDEEEHDSPVPSSTVEPDMVKQKTYHLDDVVNVWSDFLYGHFHPRTQVIVKEFLHNSDTETFDMFPQGKNLLSKRQVADDLEDRLHFFAEESDHLQGFQIITDFHDGFSGLSSGLVEILEDEYNSKGILSWGVCPSSFTRQADNLDSFRVINSVLSFDHLIQHSSLFTPLSLLAEIWRKPALPMSLENIKYNPELWYHASAILASNIDAATLPWRIIDQPVLMSQFCDLLNQGGRKVSTLSSSFPFPLEVDSTLAQFFHQHQERAPWKPLVPHSEGFEHSVPFGQSVVMRGIPESRLKNKEPQFGGILESARTVDEMTKLYLASVYPQTVSSCLTLGQASLTSTPYPHIFSQVLSEKGFIGQKSRLQDQTVKSIPLLTSLQSSPSTKGMLRSLIKEAKKLDLRKFHGYLESNIEQEEFACSVDNLEELIHCYERDFESVPDNSDEED